MTLRPYQEDAVTNALRALGDGKSVVLQMPTGAGKTKAATTIIKRHDRPVWFICHRQEIERQASAAFTAAGIEHGIVSPRAEPDYDKPVQVVSVATLARGIRDLPLPSLVIWDECHHVAAKSWAAIRNALSDSHHLGLTATPERLDGKGLSEWFDDLIVGPTTRELIGGGWLSEFRYFAPSEPDLTGARMQAGDYAKKDLARVMNMPVLIGDAVAEYRQKADGKRALVFCASVEASQELVARFNAEGVPARHVDGTTATADRDDAVAALAAGTIKVLSNVEVFTEGFDLPAIDAVILMRPTKSLALFLQMIGRALREAEGKDEALIFDHAGLWLDHDWFDLPISWSLEGGARQRRLAGRTVGPRRCPECKEVRGDREAVCSCGYEFPTGREIGEYDGVLRELRGVVPEGCETQTQFADRIGVSNTKVNYFVKKRRMPNINGHPIINDALKWIKKNAPTVPNGCKTLHVLSREYGVGRSVIVKRINRGEIETINGFPVEESMKKWVNNTIYKPPYGHETVWAFSRRVGRMHATILKWIDEGMPNQSGYPHIQKAVAWVSLNKPRHSDGITLHAYANRIGVCPSTVKRWVSKGMPVLSHGAVDPSIADDWCHQNVDWDRLEKLSKRHLKDMPTTNESASQFTRRIGVSNPMPKLWARHGFPYDKKLGIPIQEGLEWVRDNRPDIVIPPEAWPAANDNARQSMNNEAAA